MNTMNVSRVASFVVGVPMIVAYFTVRPGDLVVIFIGTLFVLWAVAGGTLMEFSVGRLFTARFREVVRAIPQVVERRVEDGLTISDRAEAKVERGGSFTADAVIAAAKSPDELAEVLVDAIVAAGRGEVHDATVTTGNGMPERD